MPVPTFFSLVLDELRRSIRTPWILVAFAVCCGSGRLAVWLGERDLQEQRRVYGEQLQTRLQVQLHFPTRVSGRNTEPGLRVLRPPNVAIALVQGQDRLMPAAWDMTPAGSELLGPYVSVGRRLETGGTWDLETVSRVFGGFLALGLGLVAVLTDRIRGWFPVLASAPLSPERVCAARLLGGHLFLLMLAVVWWTVVGLTVFWGSPESPVLLGRYWSLAIPMVLYLSVAYSIGVICAYRARGVFEAVFFGAAVWVLSSVLGPALVGLTAEMTSAQLSRGHFEQIRRDQYADDLRAVDQEFADRAARVVSPDMSVSERERLVSAELEAIDSAWQAEVLTARRTAQSLEQEWLSQQDDHHKLRVMLSWLSPGTLLRNAMAEAAGSGRDYTASWNAAVAAYTISLDHSLFDDRPSVPVRIAVGDSQFLHAQTRHDSPRYSELPTFEEPTSSWRNRMRSAGPALTGLTIWALISTFLAWRFGAQAIRA